MEEDFLGLPQTFATPPRFSSSPSSSLPVTSHGSFSTPTSSHSDTESTSSATQLSSDWHYNFKIPWHMLPAVLRKKLDKQERPTARERREMIRIISGEILAICKKPSKKHLDQIARNMVIQYPKSLKDVIEGEVVGSGHDSLTKQLQCRLDNYKRNEILKKRNTTSGNDTSTDPEKKKRVDSYGCIVCESVPVNMDAQMKKKKRCKKCSRKMTGMKNVQIPLCLREVT